MNAIQLLKEDHTKVRKLLSELAEYFAVPGNRGALRAAPGPDALRSLLLRDEAA